MELTKVILSKDIVKFYQAERAEIAKGNAGPEQRFGFQTSADIYALAKANPEYVFTVVGVEPNKYLGYDYDMIRIQVGNKVWGIRRMWLVSAN